MNLFIPTSAVVMGGLAIARVPYGTYLRWVWPLLAMLVVLSVRRARRRSAGRLRAAHPPGWRLAIRTPASPGSGTGPDGHAGK